MTDPSSDPFPDPVHAAARRPAFAACLITALVLHAMLLMGPSIATRTMPGAPQTQGLTQAISLRWIEPLPSPQPTRPSHSPAPQTSNSPIDSAPSTAGPDQSLLQTQPLASSHQAVPLYATQPPPSAQLRYHLSRGTLQAQAELLWRSSAEGYEASLQGLDAAQGQLDWRSQGRVDETGIAPQRFVMRRKGRGAQAANFQRESGRVSFSSTAAVQPWTRGAQDGLSWLLQLAAVLEAEPARAAPGSEVLLWVLGARGEADLWAFRVMGLQAPDGLGASHALEASQAPDPSRAALLLERQPQRPFDVRIQVWLSPAHHHLPIRLRWMPTGGGEALELTLQQATFLQSSR